MYLYHVYLKVISPLGTAQTETSPGMGEFEGIVSNESTQMEALIESNSEFDVSNNVELDYVSEESDGSDVSDVSDTEQWPDWDDQMIATDLNNSKILTPQIYHEQQPHDQIVKQKAVVTWILYFLSMWRSVNLISESAFSTLLLFFYNVFQWLSLHDTFMYGVAKTFPPSLFLLRKYLKIDRDNFDRFIVCSTCFKLHQVDDVVYLNSRNEKSARLCVSAPFQKVCNTPLMKKVILKGSKIEFYPLFVYPYKSLIEKLESILQRPGIENECVKWKNRTVQNGWLADIYDGRIWKSFMNYNNQDFLNCENNYAFMINVDWFQPYERRSNISVGVIYAVIMNLPRDIRYKRENLILVGIIPPLGREPSSLCSFLAPLVDELQKLWIGVQMKTFKHSDGIRVRGALLCAASDIPAARKLCGFLGHTAKLGCSRCLKKFPGGFGEQDYGGFHDVSDWPKRTHRYHIDSVEKIKRATSLTAKKKLESKYGCRYTPLLDLPYYNSIKFCVIDPMHNLYLGTAKRMWKLWISEEIIKKDDLKLIDERIRSLNIPSDCGWLPGHMESNWANLNAYEWKNFTLIYSMFVLQGILNADHIKLWQTFVLACEKISKPCITITEAKCAHNLFIKFCKSFERYFDRKKVTPNMHLHAHLIECIEDYGSIYGFWLFSFERFNGLMGSIHNNNHNIEIQLMRQFISDDVLQNMKHSLPDECNDELEKFVNGKIERNDRLCRDYYKWFEIIQSDLPVDSSKWHDLSFINLPGAHKLDCLTEDDRRLLQNTYMSLYPNETILLEHIPESICKYADLHISGEHFGSKMYKRSGRYEYIMASWCGANALIEHADLRPGNIRHFFKHSLRMGTKYIPHVFARTDWYVKCDNQCGYRRPTSLYHKRKLESPGPASYLPAQRINSKFAWAEQRCNGYDCLVVCPLQPKINL